MENEVKAPERLNLKVEKNGRDFIFSMPDQTPIGEAWDAAYQILLHLVELAKQANAKVKPIEQVEVVDVQPENENWQEVANS